MLKSKYCTKRRLTTRYPNKLPKSNVWAAISKGEKIFDKGTKWILGRESNLSFWNDNWAVKDPIRSLIEGPLIREEEHLKVKDVISGDGWNWTRVSMEIPDRIVQKTKATPFSLTTRGKDRLAWKASNNGDFELKSAYQKPQMGM